MTPTDKEKIHNNAAFAFRCMPSHETIRHSAGFSSRIVKANTIERIAPAIHHEIRTLLRVQIYQHET